MQSIQYILFTIRVLVISFLFALLEQPSAAQPAQPGISSENPAAYPDLALYQKQFKENEYGKLCDRRAHLLQTISIDSLIQDVINRGFFEVASDTASLHNIFLDDDSPLSIEERRELVDRLLKETSRYNSTHPLKQAAQFFKGRVMNNVDHYAAKTEWFEKLIRDARRRGDVRMEAYCLAEMWFSSYFSERFAEAFLYVERLFDALERVDDDYPFKGVHYVYPATSYYTFKEPEKAIHYLRKGLSYRHISPLLFSGNEMRAWDFLAAYHHQQGEADSTAYYHRLKLSSPDARFCYPAHLTIAIASLGQMELQKGNVEAATAMLEASLADLLVKGNERDFIVVVCTALAECYLEKGDWNKSRYYLDESYAWIGSDFPANIRYKRLKALYALESKYYSDLGQNNLARIYLDSALTATTDYENSSGRHFVLLGEQKLLHAQRELHSEKIARQRNVIILAVVILALVLAGSAVIAYLYRKRTLAYRSLAEKAGDWADRLPASNGNEPQTKQKGATDEDSEVMGLLRNYVITEKPYLDPSLTLDNLADRMGVPRHVLSRAINRSENGNFSQFINEFRVREVILAMKNPSTADLTLEDLISRAGFNSRNPFYQSFKKITGLTPSQYRKNMTREQ